jgi:hypothetical protein
MSWQAFSQFMWGISDLCFTAYDRLQQAEQGQSTAGYGTDAAHALDAGYDFRQHMQALAETTGICLVGLHENNASFRVFHSGESYISTVAFCRGRMRVTVSSRIQFPRRGIPSELVLAMKKVNAGQRHYKFEVLHLDDSSVFYIKMDVVPAALTPSFFQGLLGEMAANMAATDSTFIEEGFAN